MKILRDILLIASMLVMSVVVACASDGGHHDAPAPDLESEDVDVQGIIFDHLQDSYSWHVTTFKGHHVSLYLPCILYTQAGGLDVFSSKHLAHGESYEGYSISESEKYEGKIVTTDASGEEVRPLDLSLTKNALGLLINSTLMLVVFLSTAAWYKRRPKHSVPGGGVGIVEMVVSYIEDEVIVKSVGEDYKRYSPYLLTAFFFILFNNLMGLVPVFPGGANTTGNIAITLVLALATMVAVNVFGNKEYFKEIFWPDVPVWMKFPIPLMPVIEMFGVISKPFALTIRLFANIMAGHTIILSLTCLIFIVFKMGVGIGVGMTIFSVILSIFMMFLELLVAFIQAYVFTMLSAVFIGLSRPKHEHK